MTLRSPVTHDATLPDGRTIHIRVGVPDDSYIAARDLDTVAIELFDEHEHLAAVNTILEIDQVDEARALVRALVEGLESGALDATAGSIEPLADRLAR